jgi:hypothetical protein
MNGVEGTAQNCDGVRLCDGEGPLGLVFVETQNEIEQDGQYAESKETEKCWRSRKVTLCALSENQALNHVPTLLEG